MRNSKSFISLLFWFGLTGNPSFSDTPEHEALAKFTHGANQFGFHLMKSLGAETGNFMFSPLSVESALTLARLGAVGDTAKQMGEVLRLSPDIEKIQIGYWQLMRQLNGDPNEKRGFELNVANAIWLQIDFPFLPSFLALAQKTFLADLKAVDFRKNTEESRKEINRWASEKTKEKIPEIIAPGLLSPMNRLVLTNAVYFKGEWLNPFEPKLTKNEKFYLSQARTKPAAMMLHTSQFNYLNSDGAHILELPYKRSSLAMLIVIPKKVDGLESLEPKITYDLLKQWTLKSELKRITLLFPKFKFSSDYRLEKILKEMGMKLAFDPSADFGGITKGEKISIDSIAHKTFIGVDESGTEAAATTAVLYKEGGAFMQKPLQVKANRPFLFFIRDTDSEALLFIGRVAEPK